MESSGAQFSEKIDESLPRLDPAALRFVMDADWWKTNFRCASRFAPKCFVAALVLTIANVVMVCGNFVVQQRMLALKTGSEASLGDIITVMVVCLASLIVGLVATFWAVSVWTVRLTTFARAYKLYGPACTAAQFDEARDEVKGRKSFLARFWLLASGYLLIPLIPFAFLIAVRMFTRPEWSVDGQALVPLPPALSLPMVEPVVSALGSILFLIIFAYSGVSMCFAALSPRAPFQTATASLKQCLTNPLPVLAVTLVVGLVNLLLTSPLSIWALFMDPHLLERDLWYAIASQVWSGVTSTVVWTASLAPFCMITSVSATRSKHDQQ